MCRLKDSYLLNQGSLPYAQFEYQGSQEYSNLVEIAEIVEVPICYLNLQKMSIWVTYR